MDLDTLPDLTTAERADLPTVRDYLETPRTVVSEDLPAMRRLMDAAYRVLHANLPAIHRNEQVAMPLALIVLKAVKGQNHKS